MAVDKTKAMVLAYLPGGAGWIAYTVPLASFQPTSAFAVGASPAAVLTAMADGKALAIDAKGTPAAASALWRFVVGIVWSPGGSSGWTAAAGNVEQPRGNTDNRTIVAERADFASIVAAASAAWS